MKATKDVLSIGTIETPGGYKGSPFTLPLDAAAETFALLGIRGSGKTTTGKVMAEEMCEKGIPWIAYDPVGVWWGIKANKDGTPSKYPVVVIGGEKADIPLDKNAGARIAAAIIAKPVCVVIDVSQESKTTWRKFLTDFSLTLLRLTPAQAVHLFIEEAAEFVPQKTKVAQTRECKEAIERLMRLGRNKGYGCTLINQRPATIDKDVISQAENLLVLRTVGKHDRKALAEWMEPKLAGEDNVREAGMKLTAKLAGFKDGRGYFWSPNWLNVFHDVQIRDAHTFHPGHTRRRGQKVQKVEMFTPFEAISRLQSELDKTKPSPARTPTLPTPQRGRRPGEFPTAEENVEKYRTEKAAQAGVYQNQISALKDKLSISEKARSLAEQRLAKVREHLKPQYESLRVLFEELGTGGNGQSGDLSVYAPWLQKAGGGTRKRMLEVMIERQEVTRTQLATLAVCSQRSGTFRNNLSWLKSNGLILVEGSNVRLIAV